MAQAGCAVAGRSAELFTPALSRRQVVRCVRCHGVAGQGEQLRKPLSMVGVLRAHDADAGCTTSGLPPRASIGNSMASPSFSMCSSSSPCIDFSRSVVKPRGAAAGPRNGLHLGGELDQLGKLPTVDFVEARQDVLDQRYRLRVGTRAPSAAPSWALR